VTFFQNAEWRAHFLKWVESGQFAGAVTAPLLEVFVQANLRRIDSKALTRQQGLDFIESVLAPRASDPAVAKIVAARTGSGNGLDGLRELASTEEYFKQGKVVSRVGDKEVRGMSGRDVLDGKVGKLYYNVVDLFNGYRSMLDSPEGKRDQSRPLSPAQFPSKERVVVGGGRQRGRADWTAAVAPERGPRGRFLDTRPSKPPSYAPPPIPNKGPVNSDSLPDPSTLGPLPPIPGTKAVRPLPPIPVPKAKPPRPPRVRWKPAVNDPVSARLNPRQQSVLASARDQAATDAGANEAKAKEQILKAGVPAQQVDAVLKEVTDYIRDATPTINFNPSHGKLDLYEKIEGYSPNWMAPKETIEQETPGYLNKRNLVEQNFFGYDDDPHESGKKEDRPVYASANLGEAVSGGAEQYGYSYFELNDEVKDRSTYSQRDTYSGFDVRDTNGPSAPKAEGSTVQNIGTREHLEGVIADMAPEKLSAIIAQMHGDKGVRGQEANQYVELHIHGGIDWSKDIKRIVIDRAIVKQGSRLEQHLMRFAGQYHIPLAFYDHKKWVDDAGSDLKLANLTHAPAAVESKELKLGTADGSAPGTIVSAEVKPDAKELMITAVKQEEKGSPATTEPVGAPSGQVKALAARLGKDLKFPLG